MRDESAPMDFARACMAAASPESVAASAVRIRRRTVARRNGRERGLGIEERR